MKLAASVTLAALLTVATAASVLAHSGTLAGTSTCDGYSATVTLNHNTTSDRLVTVTTDIPGASGLSGHFDTTYGLIWSATGPALTAPGHVTLTIGTEFSQSLTLEVPSGCQTSIPSPSPTPSGTPTTAPSATPPPTTAPSANPSPSTEPTPSDAPSATPTGSILAATGTPGLTPPPTSTTPPTTPPDRKAGLLAVLLTGLASGVLVFRRLRTVR